jgi:hypothetical protein
MKTSDSIEQQEERKSSRDNTSSATQKIAVSSVTVDTLPMLSTIYVTNSVLSRIEIPDGRIEGAMKTNRSCKYFLV